MPSLSVHLLLWSRPRTETSMPLLACWSITRPRPLKQVTRCHSVSLAVKPLASLKVLPSLSRLGRLVPRLKVVTSVPPLVVRLWGSAPRLPTRITIFVIGSLLLMSPGPPRRQPEEKRGEAAARTAGEAAGEPKDQGRRGQPEGQHGPQGRRLRTAADEPGRAGKGDGVGLASRRRLTPNVCTTRHVGDSLPSRYDRRVTRLALTEAAENGEAQRACRPMGGAEKSDR